MDTVDKMIKPDYYITSKPKAKDEYDYGDVFVAVKKRRWVSLRGIVVLLVEIMPRNMTKGHLR